MNRPPPFDRATWALGIATLLLLVGAGLLLDAYPALPAEIPLARGPSGPILGARTPLTVGRLVGMGVGQLGACWAMARASRSHPAWRRFWSLAGMVAGLKTLAECAQLATGGGAVYVVAAATPVVLFLLDGLRRWRAGEYTAQPPMGRLDGLLLGLSLLLWLAMATAPRWAA